MKSTTLLIAGAAMALATGAIAVAQTPAPPAPHEHHMDGPKGEARDPTERLRAVLQLRPSQHAALAAFVSAMKPDPERMSRVRDQAPAKTTPERLARMEQAMTERQTIMRARIEATRRFYDQLDAGQKKAFDAIGPMQGRGGKMMRMRHEGHRGPMHGAPRT